MKFRRTIFGVLAAVISGSALGQTPCSAHSPEHAVPAGWSADTGDTNPPPSRAASGWYRLDHVLVDPTLHRRWAFIANCSHPEWPLQVVALTGPSILPTTAANATPGPQAAPVAVKRVPPAVAMDRPAPSKQPFPPYRVAPNYTATPVPISSSMELLVRAGDMVHLWSSEKNVRLEINAVAVEYGHAGQVIHLRRMGQSTLLAGVVVGKDSAELMP